jgi:hypothetical protein
MQGESMTTTTLRLRALRAAAIALTLCAGTAAQALEPDQLDASFTPTIKAHGSRLNTAADGNSGVLGNRYSGSQLGIDTLPNWSSYFYYPGLVPTAFGAFPQFTWQYTMVGRSPVGSRPYSDGDDSVVTRIRAPIVPVILDLRNFDGTPRYFTRADGTQVRMILDPTQYIQPVLASPVFAKASYSSSYRPTQLNDAIQRAEFYNTAGPGWHTLLVPVVAPTRTMVLIRGTYRFSINATTGVLNYVLVDDAVFANALFPPTATDTSTVMGAAENAGDIRTTDLSTFLFANTFLFSDADGSCCVLGYHSYDVEPGSAANGFRERHYVMNYSSWISPGIFGGGFQDITALSHELAETFNDPFVNNATPIWVAPNGLCQNNLEVGDVIEGLANGTFAMTMNGYTYHPQNEALVQWFAGVTPSSAIGGAYSYPDPTVLTSAAVSLSTDCATPAF